ncbi:MAG: STAS domain-containing protein [Bacteroidales bacterium]|jgi:SulP family sulfate permease|nr:STAS domain-containing protein [Bacteroidales bacterium]
MNKFSLKEVFSPKLFQIVKDKSYSKELFLQDFIAGIVVGIVSIPLAIAFGIASGVSPQQGLITAIIGGFIVSLLGGSNVQIGGPTGAFIIVVVGIISEFGFTGLIIATVIGGIILVVMGLFRLGDIIKFMPYPIIVGFTSGIAFILVSTQIKDFFGLTSISGEELVIPSDFFSKWQLYFENFSTINPFVTSISVLTIVISFSWSRVTKKIPGSIVAIILLTLVTFILKQYFAIDIPTIGTKYPELIGGSPLPKASAPPINLASIGLLLRPALTIAVLCAIESLLSAMVADGATGKKHNSNTELIGQGLANIVVPFFGGIPVTGAIARTMTNINNGGKTPVAGLVNALFLILVFLFLMPLIAYIPFASLAGVLCVVAYNMSEWRTFKGLLNNPISDVIVLLTTFFLTVIFDLTIAIEVGLLIAAFSFIKRVMETSSIKVIENEIKRTENPEEENIEKQKISKYIEVYEIDGPFFFGVANKFDEISYAIKTKPKVRIIRMRNVPFIDSTGIKNLTNLYNKSKKEKIQVILSGVVPNVYHTLEKSRFIDKLGKEFVFDHITKAMDKANEIVNS